MTQYAALIYSARRRLDAAAVRRRHQGVRAFAEAAVAVIRGGAALYPTSTATSVRVEGKGGKTLTTDGPYAETKEALTGFYLLECADLDEAVKVASTIPGAWDGVVEVRPVIEFPM